MRLWSARFFLLLFFAAGAASAQSKDPCNFMLISLDTLRADHLKVYGYSKETAPNLTAFAKDAYVFTKMFSPSTVTLQSHMSMFTGLYPVKHKVLNVDFHNKRHDILSKSITTLPKFFQRQGFATIFVGGDPIPAMLAPQTGFARGVDFFSSISLQDETRVKNFISTVDSISANKPFFAFVHTWRIHDPYTVPGKQAHIPGVTRVFVSDGEYYNALHTCEKRRRCILERIQRTGWAKIVSPDFLTPYEAFFRTQIRVGNRGDLQQLVRVYDHAISYTDGLLGQLFDSLKERKKYDRTVIAITSDHGEEFLEHEWLGHGNFYDESIHVPFILRVPVACRKSGMPKWKVSKKLASTVDILPTLLWAAGIDVPKGLQGINLLSNETRDAVFGSKMGRLNRMSFYARSKNYKVIEENPSSLMVYNLRTDIKERKQILNIPEEALRLIAKLRNFQFAN